MKTQIERARAALEDWDADEADEAEIAAVFAAIYERQPDDEDDAASLIFAARDVLDDAEAARLLEVL